MYFYHFLLHNLNNSRMLLKIVLDRELSSMEKSLSLQKVWITKKSGDLVVHCLDCLIVMTHVESISL